MKLQDAYTMSGKRVYLTAKLRHRSKENTLERVVDALSLKLHGMTLSKAHKKRICLRCRKRIPNSDDMEIKIDYEISGLCKECQERR